MSSFFHKGILSILVSILIVSGVLYASPPAPPDWKPAWWLFSVYFKNIIGGNLWTGTCPPWQVIVWFNTWTSWNLYGVPICQTVAWNTTALSWAIQTLSWSLSSLSWTVDTLSWRISSLLPTQWSNYPNNTSPTGIYYPVGNVGIGVMPWINTSLKINGDIQIWNNDNPCSSIVEWSIRYNSIAKVFEWCNSISWLSLKEMVAYTYSWNTGNWSSCSASCWWWNQSRIVNCQRNDGVIVADLYCTGTKPIVSQTCNMQSCCISNYTYTACNWNCWSLTPSVLWTRYVYDSCWNYQRQESCTKSCSYGVIWWWTCTLYRDKTWGLTCWNGTLDSPSTWVKWWVESPCVSNTYIAWATSYTCYWYY